MTILVLNNAKYKILFIITHRGGNLATCNNVFKISEATRSCFLWKHQHFASVSYVGHEDEDLDHETTSGWTIFAVDCSIHIYEQAITFPPKKQSL